MAGNSFGTLFKVTTFGESHGAYIGVTIDGCPAGLELDMDYIQSQLDRRKPGQSALSSQRKESDSAQFISGVFEGKTLGTPITVLLPNEDARSKDYQNLENAFRPSHADFTYQSKYGIRDYRGGGRSSARETAARVIAGTIAELLLSRIGIAITAYVSSISTLSMDESPVVFSKSQIDASPVRCPIPGLAEKMEKRIAETRKEGDSVGGIITCIIQHCPVGLGEPVFDKLQADLAKAMLSINAVKGFEYGSGFAGTQWKGSEHNDRFVAFENQVKTQTNFSGGIQGGISNGMDIYFRVAFKPTATILKPQTTIDSGLQPIDLQVQGRHDPCVVPRAVPIVESMAAIVLADHLLRHKSSRIDSLHL
ncbi:MAG: chorismate synthase [Bacteroidia bacterium]|nr:chorismate synthase [Bacteroidia bacterium]